jgi:tetratricopeptide (TPR) repeat protein
MTQENDPINNCLVQLGYNEKFIKDISAELNKLFKDIDFASIEQRVNFAILEKNTAGLITSLKDLMFRLEDKGIYRPEAPVRVIRLLINGLNLKNEDIFYLIARTQMSLEDKLKEQEFLASCAAITQLGYVMLKCLVPEVKAASSGEHVFLVIDSFSPDSRIFVDFSIDSIKEVNVNLYEVKENHWKLRENRDLSGLETETAEYLTQYYSFFQLASGIGLNHNIHNNLGLAYDKIGRFDEAIEELKAALHLSADYVEVHNNLGVTYDKMDMSDEAQTELQEAIRMNPGYLEAHCNLGNIYACCGKLDEALLELEEVQRINPRYAPLHNSLGNIHALENRESEAIKEFMAALEIDPKYVPARMNLAHIYYESGRHEEALREFNNVLSLDPILPEGYFGIGLVFNELKSYEKATQAFIHAVHGFPGFMDRVPDALILKVKQGVSRLK